MKSQITNTRKLIYEIVENPDENDFNQLSRIYDYVMLAIILISTIPLWTHKVNSFLLLIDRTTVIIFIIDYIMRWIVADYTLGDGKKSFLKYPFTPMAIIDLLSILPGITLMVNALRLLKIFRFIKMLKVFRMFKTARYFKSFEIFNNIFKRKRDDFIVVLWIAIIYVVIAALVVFNAEPDTFETMFDAIYWATITLTTVGYGDIYTVTTVGRIITMVSNVVGVIIIALPAGIFVAGYEEEMFERRSSGENKTEAEINKSKDKI